MGEMKMTKDHSNKKLGLKLKMNRSYFETKDN